MRPGPRPPARPGIPDPQRRAPSGLVLAPDRGRGRFYPDFVARLDDGRRLVVEYKGGLTAEGSDTDEKRAVGALWERKSGGRGLFIVVEKQVDGRDVRTQLLRKIGVVPGTSSGP